MFPHPFAPLPLCPFAPQAICDVSLAQISDVDKAVAAAKEAFEEGEWGRMNPRDRGRLLYKSVGLSINQKHAHEPIGDITTTSSNSRTQFLATM